MPQLIFQAIADPTRREIIDLLAASPMPVNDVASHFDISRPAISRHIKILQECGLVVIRQSGRKRYCRADTQKLQEIIAWANQYRGFWNNKRSEERRVGIGYKYCGTKIVKKNN